jgi:hypothetical protein
LTILVTLLSLFVSVQRVWWPTHSSNQISSSTFWASCNKHLVSVQCRQAFICYIILTHCTDCITSSSGTITV